MRLRDYVSFKAEAIWSNISKLSKHFKDDQIYRNYRNILRLKNFSRWPFLSFFKLRAPHSLIRPLVPTFPQFSYSLYISRIQKPKIVFLKFLPSIFQPAFMWQTHCRSDDISSFFSVRSSMPGWPIWKRKTDIRQQNEPVFSEPNYFIRWLVHHYHLKILKSS